MSTDDSDRAEAGLGAPSALPWRAAVGVVIVVSVAVIVTFLLALGAARPVEAVHVVVVADPQARAGSATPVRVLGVHRQRLVPLDVVVNGATVDGDGFGRAVVDDDRRLHVTGTARLGTGEARTVDLAVALPTPTPLTVSTSPAPLVDRDPVGWRFDGDDVVILTARTATSAVISAFVGDQVVGMQRLELAVGETRWPVPSAPAHDGDLVVVGLATSLLPSAPVRQLVTRTGGLRDADPRSAPGQRLVVASAVPTIVSPPFSQQSETAKQRDVDDADHLRAIFRGSAVAQVLCLLLMAIAARPRFVTAVLALLLVVGFDIGLDAVLGVTASEIATSGSP